MVIRATYANTVTWKILCYLSNDPSSTATKFSILTLFESCHFSVMYLSQKEVMGHVYRTLDKLTATPHDDNTLKYPFESLHIIFDIMMQFFGHISAILKYLHRWRVEKYSDDKKNIWAAWGFPNRICNKLYINIYVQTHEVLYYIFVLCYLSTE